MVTFAVKKKSVFFSQAAFQLFKFIQILFIYLPFSPLKGKSPRPGRGLLLTEAWLPFLSSCWNAWFNLEKEGGMDFGQETASRFCEMTVSYSSMKEHF